MDQLLSFELSFACCVNLYIHSAAASATFLYRQYGNASNDGAVLRVDAEIPGSTAVRPSEECDHMQAEFATQWPPKTKMPLSGSDVLSSTSIGALVYICQCMTKQ